MIISLFIIYYYIQYILTYLFCKIFIINNVNFLFKKENGGKIYLGDMITSTDAHFLENNNIEVIINCTNDLPFNNNYKIKNYRCGISDLTLNSEKENQLYKEKINYFLEIIDKALNNNKNILIHCRNGMQRSAAMVASYLIKYNNLTKDEAIIYIKNKRWIAFKPINIFDSLLSDMSLR